MQDSAKSKFHCIKTIGFTVGLALIAACSTLPAQAATTVVKLTDQEMFTPKTVTIHAGDAVKWVNASSAVHTVTDDPTLAASAKDSTLPKGADAFNSGFLKAGQTYTYLFKIPGEYHYFCILHESLSMVGTIVVK